MRVEFLGLVTILLGVILMLAPVKYSFTWMMLSTAFGAAAAFTLSMGASILVPNLFLLFFTMRIFMAFGEGQIFAAFSLQRAGFILLVLTVFGLLTAVFFPRLFQGMTETMVVERSVGLRNIISLVPLRASASNITQPVYALGGLVAFASTFAFFRCTGTHDDLIRAALITARVILIFALIDIVTYFSRTEYLLSFVRTANYALLTAAEKGGLKRISGTFPEASAFAGYTLILFAMLASLWLDNIRARTTGRLTILLLIALIFSTSATGLVGIAAIIPVLFLRSLFVSPAGRPHPPALFIAVSIAATPLVVLLVFATLPEVSASVSSFFDEMLFSKADSQSGRERAEWNAVAYKTFLDTFGLGAGLGSARASSFVLVLLSNVGVLGILLFGLFIWAVLSASPPARQLHSNGRDAAMRAAKMGILAVLVEASTSGTVYDLGLMIYVLAGATTALASPHAFSASEPVSNAMSSQERQS
ncbi:hypothetical protein [Rhizobium sullae]|nr:hypothetical protein [Rhizobium sullae]